MLESGLMRSALARLAACQLLPYAGEGASRELLNRVAGGVLVPAALQALEKVAVPVASDSDVSSATLAAFESQHLLHFLSFGWLRCRGAMRRFI